MIQRFEGEAGRRTLAEALREQKLVAGDTALAEQIATTAKLMAIKAGTPVIERMFTSDVLS